MKKSKIKTLLHGQWRWGARSLLIFWLSLTGVSLSAHASLIGSGVQIDNLTGADDNASISFDGANYLAVWQTSTGASFSSDIYAGVFTPGGTTVIPPFPVNAGTNDQNYPAVSSYASNQFLIVYQTFNGTDFDISGAFVSYSTTSTPNTTVGTPFLIAGGAGNQQYPSVAYDGSTGFYVTYVDIGTAVKAVSVSKSGVAGAPVTLGTVTSSTPPSVLPQISFSNSTIAQYLVAWEDFGADPSGNIYANTITTTGTAGAGLGMAVTASTPERHPSVAFDGTNFLVVYDKGSPGSRDVFGQLVTPALALSGASFPVSSAVNDQLTPKLTFSAGANLYFASWQDYRNSTTNADIYGARISKAGAVNETGGLAIMTNTTFQKQNPVTGNDGSNFFTVWTDFRNPPTGSDIWGQNADGPPPAISTVAPTTNLTAGTLMTVSGNYFGDLPAGSRSTSTDYLSISGVKVPDSNVSQWANTSVFFTLPVNSTSGPLQVVSGTLGSNTVSLAVQDFTLASTPASQTAGVGSNASFTLTLTSVNSFASPITLSVTGLPSGAGGAFSANPVTPTTSGASSILTVSVSLSAAPGTYALQVTGIGGGETHAIPVTLNIASLPVVQTSPTTGITQTGATLNGTVNPNGQATTAWFDYGITTAYGSSTPAFSLTSGSPQTSLSTTISGLTLGTTYHFRLTAKNSLGTVYGGDYSFITLANPPVVVTGIPSNRTTTSVTLNGTANPNGVPGSAWFEYGLTLTYGNATNIIPISGNFDNFVSVNLMGLSSYSIYHFRIVASNNGGTSQGLDQTFNTYTIPFYGQPDIELLTSPVTMFNGVNSSDFAGTAVANGGDISGDGIKDLIICADHVTAPANSAYPSGRTNAGACYIFFGRLAGWPSPTTLDQADLTIYGANANDLMGHSVSISGDLNGDGFADIVIGAPSASPVLKTTTRIQAGQVYVINGRANFYKDYPAGIIDLYSEAPNVTISGANPYDNIGDAVTTAGDINGDFFPDLVISAPKIGSTGVNQSGQIYIIFGKGTLPGLIDLSTTTGGADVIIGGFQTSGLSSAISISGDVNGDGMNDLIAGVQGYTPFSKTGSARVQAGGAFLFYGRKIWPSAATPMNIQNADLTFNGINTGDQAGSSVTLGDLNKDGKADIIIGARMASPYAKANSGSTYIVLGQAAYTNPVIELNSANATINGAGSNDQSGRVLSSSDLNGDGYIDLLIGAPSASPGGRTNAGSVYVILGKAVFPSVINLATTFDTVINGAYSGDFSGVAIDASGDINGDLLTDIVIGANNASPALKAYPFVNKFAGQAYLIFGNNQYDVTPPSVPAGLSVALTSDSQIGLTWTASTDNVAVAGYEIYRNGAKVATVGGVIFTDSGLQPDTKYTYQVLAFDLAGNKSALSSPLMASTLADTVPPTSPTNLTAVSVSPSQINLSWSPGSDDIGVAGYQVWRSINGTTYIQIANVSGTTFFSTGLSPSTINYYYIKTYDAAGNVSLPSNVASAVTLADTIPPTTPTGLHAVTISASEIDLWWYPSADDVGVAGYQIWRSTDNVTFTQISAVTSTIFADLGLTTVQKYFYYVKAYDISGNISTASNTAYAVNDITPPTAPATVTGSVISPGEINLSWAAATDNTGSIFQYYIYSSTNNVTFTLAGVVGGNILTFSHTGLLANTSYYYEVKATDLAENVSPASPTAGPYTTFTDIAPPTNPAGLTGVDGVTSVSLTWTASTDNSGTVASYQIWRAVGASTCANPPVAPFAQAGSSTVNSYVDNALSPATTYSYCVLAVDLSNNRSGPSNSLTTATLADTVAPSIPSNLKATAVSETQVNLSWAPSIDNVAVTGYQITRTPGPVVLTSLTTSYSDSGLFPWTAYTYTIKAYDSSGNFSLPSASVLATTLDMTKPVWPTTTGFLATTVSGANGASQIGLSWPQAADNAVVAGYTIWQSTNNISFAQVGSQLGAANTSFLNTGLQPNITYYFYIIAFDGAGNNSLPSPAFSATTTPDTATPTIPTTLVVTSISDSKLGLSWTASTDNVSVAGYQIFRTTLSTCVIGTSCWINIGTTPVNSWIDSFNLVASTPYYYYLVAYDPSGNLSGPSVIASGTTLADTTPPTVPRGIVAIVASNQTQVNLIWIPSIDNSGTVASYSVYRNGIPAGTALSNSFSDIGLQANQTYIYTLSAKDSSGIVSALSAPVTAVTDVYPPTIPCSDLAAPCSPVGAPFAIAVTVSEIDVSWAASKDLDLSSGGGAGSGIAGYKVYRSDLINPIGITTASSTIFADKGLVPKTTYNYRVSAFDRAGNESAQSAVIVISTPPDTTPPSVPAGLIAALAAPYQISLNWVPSSDNDRVAGYKIYRNGALYMFTTATSFADAGLSPGTTFTYTISAYDRSGNESAQSSSVSATTGP
ncbi:MAG: FG-GAP repeat protein [Nitrospirae bacterium]|nr:FG-GAP repeat protein [Nitrospirota bacterium]